MVVTSWEGRGALEPIPGCKERGRKFPWRKFQGRYPLSPEPYHCFAIEIERAAYVRFEERIWEWWSWDPDSGLRKEEKPNE